MKAVSFFQITRIGEPSKTRLTPVTRSRLQTRGLNFFEITEFGPRTAPRESDGVSFFDIENLERAGEEGPSLDSLFEKTIGDFESKFPGEEQSGSGDRDSDTDSDLQLYTQPTEGTLLEKAQEFHEASSQTPGVRSRRSAGSDNPWVMLVEDDAVLSGFLVHLLKRRGFEVHHAEDGLQAEKMLDEIPPPQLVILDIMLPFVDGFELIEKIRDRDLWKDVPIMMLTSKTQEHDIVRALDNGANDYVVKPFQSQELIARVHRFMR